MCVEKARGYNIWKLPPMKPGYMYNLSSGFIHTYFTHNNNGYKSCSVRFLKS